MSFKPSSHLASKPPCRVGFDLSILDRVDTGTSVYAWNLFQSLKELGQADFEFIELRAPKPLPRKNILTKFSNFALEIFWLNILLPAKARKLRLDLLHMPANIISPTLRIPQVCTIHDAHFITNPKGRDSLWRLYARWSFRYAARHADQIICVSNASRDEVVRLLGADPENIDVVPNGLPHRVSQAADLEAAAKYAPYILTVGSTDPNKNFPALVEAFAELIATGRAQDHKLVLAGPPGSDHPNLEKLINEKSLQNHVILAGRVSDSRLAALYQKASLFAFPTLCEGFGFPPLEAMSYGVAVAASNAPCVPETLGEAALFFDPRDITAMADKIHLLLSNQELRDRLIQAGYEQAKKFTWEKTAELTMASYRSKLAKAGTKG